MKEEDPGRAAPQQTGQTAGHGAREGHAQAEGEGQPEHHPEHERPVDEPDPGVGQQVLGVDLLVGHLHVGEHPADVGVEEPVQRPPPARAVAHVGAVRIALDVGVPVVLTMRGHPVDHRALCGGRPQRREQARSGRLVLKLRWVRSRWKPTVIPLPMTT